MSGVGKVRLYVTLDDRSETSPKTKILNLTLPFTHAQLSAKIAKKLKIDTTKIESLEGYHRQEQTHFDTDSDEDEFDCDDFDAGTIIYVSLKKSDLPCDWNDPCNSNSSTNNPTEKISNSTTQNNKNNNNNNTNKNVVNITHESKIELKIESQEETLESLLDSQTLTNPYVILNGISDYSKAKPDGEWHDLDGVIVDITSMIDLWNGIYGYNNMSVSLRDHNSNNNDQTIKNKNENEKGDSVCYVPTATANTQSYNDFLVDIRAKIDSSKCNDGLIYYYSGHGVKNAIILENGAQFSIKHIFQTFNGTQCVLPRNKPKIMIFDSCRGSRIGGTYDIEPVTITKGPKNRRNQWIDSKFHANTGLATIFSNFEDYTINDSDYGGSMTRAICKVFNNLSRIVNHSLRDLIIALRRQTKIYSGRGNVEHGSSSELVDFHETLEYKVYFRSNSGDDKLSQPLNESSLKALTQTITSTNAQQNELKEHQVNGNFAFFIELPSELSHTLKDVVDHFYFLKDNFCISRVHCKMNLKEFNINCKHEYVLKYLHVLRYNPHLLITSPTNEDWNWKTYHTYSFQFNEMKQLIEYWCSDARDGGVNSFKTKSIAFLKSYLEFCYGQFINLWGATAFCNSATVNINPGLFRQERYIQYHPTIAKSIAKTAQLFACKIFELPQNMNLQQTQIVTDIGISMAASDDSKDDRKESDRGSNSNSNNERRNESDQRAQFAIVKKFRTADPPLAKIHETHLTPNGYNYNNNNNNGDRIYRTTKSQRVTAVKNHFQQELIRDVGEAEKSGLSEFSLFCRSLQDSISDDGQEWKLFIRTQEAALKKSPNLRYILFDFKKEMDRNGWKC